MQLVKFISKHTCHALIFTLFQVSCNGNISKFGAEKEREHISCSNSSPKQVGNIANEEAASCSICFEEYANNADWIQLLCGSSTITHDFHKSCICEWLNNSETCPTCRGPITQNMLARINPHIYLFKAIEKEDLKSVQYFIQNDPFMLNEACDLKYLNKDRGSLYSLVLCC